jgi:hypothetical protein
MTATRRWSTVDREPPSTASDAPAAGDPGADGDAAAKPNRRLTLRLEEFAWRALVEEARRLEVSIHELASFAVLYYLADHDSGRTARRLPPPSGPTGRHPLWKLLRG